MQKIKATDGTDGDLFGRGLTLFGNIIMVSALHQGTGTVYAFYASNGTQFQKFENANISATHVFGASWGMVIHASKNIGIVGHGYDNGNGTLSFAGAVHIFDLTTGVRIRKIMQAKPAARMFFGHTLLLSGDFLLVGASGTDSNNGRVHVFDINADWMEIAFFGPCDNQAGGRFGSIMVMSGPRFIVTAPLHSSDQKKNGAMYVGDVTAGVNYSKFIHMHLLM